ncbi:MAG: hypothetical protein HY069_03305 [Chlamydiia bacterium]|nr:hypothetical protein [Chlamydiia bacterium]
MPAGLRASEWSLVGTFILILATFTLIAKIKSHQAQYYLASYQPKVQKILVTFHGAVAKPGRYTIKKGVPLCEALKKAKPHRYANLRNLDLQAPIVQPLDLHLEPLSELIVHVRINEGQVRDIVMPLRSRVSDLKTKIDEPYDPAALKSRRFLRDGEQLCVFSANK